MWYNGKKESKMPNRSGTNTKAKIAESAWKLFYEQ